MRLLSLIPLLAILLINIIVLAWVLRHRGPTRSGFFLVMNALSLIVWAGGQGLYRVVGQISPWVLSLPYLAALVVPGNFLYYALTRPHPMREIWKTPWGVGIIFVPALILVLIESYSPESVYLFGYSYRSDRVDLDTIAHRAALLYITIVLMASVAILGVRYYTSSGPDQNTSKHLIATVLGPIMFAAFFWVSSNPSGPTVLPSPSFLFALMSQVGLIVVLRQENVQNPRALSRTVYYMITILAAFVLMHLLSEFYVFVEGSIVLEREAGWILLGCTLVLLLVAQFTRVSGKFDELIFNRAADYRRVVEETRLELKEARERLRKAERLSVAGEISARMAHEIKNPLGPIRGYTQMMRERLEKERNFPDRERFLEYLTVIQEEVDSIDRRVRDFLSAARHPQMMVEKTDINQIVEQCVRVMRLELSAGRDVSGIVLPVTIQADTDPELEPIQADTARLEEAIFNVARNALDALVDNTRGRIILRTRRVQGRDGEEGAEVSVLDNGPGFPVENIERLFEPFFTQRTEGTGLGLAIVKSNIEAHGGTIELHNRPHGGGEVRIWLPAVARQNPGALLPRPVGQDA